MAAHGAICQCGSIPIPDSFQLSTASYKDRSIAQLVIAPAAVDADVVTLVRISDTAFSVSFVAPVLQIREWQ